MKKNHIIVYSFQSLSDPLLKGLMLSYLKNISTENKFHFHLITHEQKIFELSSPEKENVKQQLEKEFNISWHPIAYHSGKFLLLKKIYDFLKTFFICLNLKRDYRIKTITGFLPIAGGYSAILSKLLRMKLVVYCFEPHSEYLADFGTWKRNSVAFRLLHFFEKFQVKNADYLVVPTSHSKTLATSLGAKGKLFVCPISVDTRLFRFDSKKREEYRQQWGAGNKTVIIYTGKFGGIYYNVEEVISFFEQLNSASENYFLFIISPESEKISEYLKEKLLPVKVIPPVKYEDLAGYISAADIGMLAVPPFPSQKYRTPVKTGIYLSCGIPYLVNRGIAEDDELAEKEKTGVVTEDFRNTDARLLDKKIQQLLSEGEAVSSRCRRIAEKTRDTSIASGILNDIFTDIYSR